MREGSKAVAAGMTMRSHAPVKRLSPGHLLIPKLRHALQPRGGRSSTLSKGSDAGQREVTIGLVSVLGKIEQTGGVAVGLEQISAPQPFGHFWIRFHVIPRCSSLTANVEVRQSIPGSRQC